MAIVKLLAANSKYFLCQVNNSLLDRLNSDPEILNGVLNGIISLGHTPSPNDCPSDSVIPLVIDLDCDNVLTVSTTCEPEVAHSATVSEFTEDHPVNFYYQCDDLKSPPKKKTKEKRFDAPTVPPQGMYKFVEITNMPEDFIKDHFVRFLNKKMKLHCDATALPVSSCSVSDGGLVTVEFLSEELALKFWESVQEASLSYEDCELSVKLGNDGKCFSDTVFVNGLADDFIPMHFVRFINKEAKRLGVSGSNVAVHCSDFIRERGGADLKFSSAEIATEFCTLAEIIFIVYEEERLIFDQQYRQQTSATRKECGEKPLQSPFVAVSNLPEDFIEAHFLAHLKRILVAYEVVDENEYPIMGIVNRKDDSLVIEFSSIKLAQEACAACLAGDWEYEDSILCMKTVPPDSISKSVNMPCDVDGSSKVMSDYEMNLMFVKVMLRLRHLFTGRNHDAAYARIYNDLSQLGITWDVSTLTRKRRNLLDQYKKKAKNGSLDNWELWKPLAVIQNLASYEILKDTDFADNSTDTFASDLCKFTKGAVWTISASKALIAICQENKEVFLNDTVRHSAFFKQVSNLLAEKNHFYDAAQCERKVLSLKKNYRDEMQRLKQTGAPAATKFGLVEEMSELMVGDVTVHPKRTQAVGVVPRLVTVSEEHLEDHVPSSGSINKGLTRPPTLRRPRGLAERRVKAIEDIAEAFTKKYSP